MTRVIREAVAVMLLCGALFGLAVVSLAEAIHHAGLNPFEPAASTSIVGERP